MFQDVSEHKQDRLLRLKHVLEMVPVRKSTWWGWVATGKAPAAIKLGPSTTCWRLSDIQRFMEARI
jgi:predicted DNA-binding transcriptional regulator AlpA